MTYTLSSNGAGAFDFNGDRESVQPFPHFQSGEIVNDLEMVAMDILEMMLGDRFRYCPQVPLEVICSRTEAFSRLPDQLWKFWVSSRVDLALMERHYGSNRKAKLVIECQSHWHDSFEAQVRDRKKARLLAAVGVPLVYVRRIEEDKRFYRFYTANNTSEVIYNLVTQTGWADLEEFLHRLLT